MRLLFVLTALLIAIPQHAAALGFVNPFEVEELAIGAGDSLSNPPLFFDDFEASDFASGFYTVGCGGEPFQSGGALILNDAGPCAFDPVVQQLVGPNLFFTGDATATAKYRFQAPAPSEGYGLAIVFPALPSPDFIRADVVGFESGGDDFVIFVIYDEVYYASRDPADFLAASSPVPADGLVGDVLTVEITLDQVASDLIPTATFTLDSTTMFAPGSLPAGALDAEDGTFFGATLAASTVPEPTTALLLAFGLAGLAAAGGRRSLH